MYCVCHRCEDVLPIFSNQLHMNRFYCMLQILMHTNNVFEMESVDGIENRYDGKISLVFIAPLIYGFFCIICVSTVYTCKVHIPGVKGCFKALVTISKCFKRHLPPRSSSIYGHAYTTHL